MCNWTNAQSHCRLFGVFSLVLVVACGAVGDGSISLPYEDVAKPSIVQPIFHPPSQFDPS